MKKKQQHSPTRRSSRPFSYRPTRVVSRRMLIRGLREEVEHGPSLSKLYAQLLLKEVECVDHHPTNHAREEV